VAQHQEHCNEDHQLCAANTKSHAKMLEAGKKGSCQAHIEQARAGDYCGECAIHLEGHHPLNAQDVRESSQKWESSQDLKDGYGWPKGLSKRDSDYCRSGEYRSAAQQKANAPH
jgi:hypothetical protein